MAPRCPYPDTDEQWRTSTERLPRAAISAPTDRATRRKTRIRRTGAGRRRSCTRGIDRRLGQAEVRRKRARCAVKGARALAFSLIVFGLPYKLSCQQVNKYASRSAYNDEFPAHSTSPQAAIAAGTESVVARADARRGGGTDRAAGEQPHHAQRDW